MHVHERPIPRQRIDRQLGTERRAADADVNQVADLAERTAVDRIDQQVHPVVQLGRLLDRGFRANAPLGGMLGGGLPGMGGGLAGMLGGGGSDPGDDGESGSGKSRIKKKKRHKKKR